MLDKQVSILILDQGVDLRSKDIPFESNLFYEPHDEPFVIYRVGDAHTSFEHPFAVRVGLLERSEQERVFIPEVVGDKFVDVSVNESGECFRGGLGAIVSRIYVVLDSVVRDVLGTIKDIDRHESRRGENRCYIRARMAARERTLLAVIGDEVRLLRVTDDADGSQDTVTGMLLAGIGQITQNKKNFLVVDGSLLISPVALCTRR
jgi:hypothetical protein